MMGTTPPIEDGAAILTAGDVTIDDESTFVLSGAQRLFLLRLRRGLSSVSSASESSAKSVNH